MNNNSTLQRARRFTLCLGLTVAAVVLAGHFTASQAQEAPAAGAAPAPAPAAPAAPAKPESLWTMLKAGGPTLIILGACSIFTMTLVIERFMFYRKAGGNSADLVDRVKKAGTMSEALAAIENVPGITARVIRVALQACRDGYPPDQIQTLVEGEVAKELIGMEKFLPQLDSMVTMCPLIGLLGTTLGMIKSFHAVAQGGMKDPTVLAGGISEALINTAGGLAVAIPALFAYNWFTGNKEAILMDMEKGLSEVMVILRSSTGA